MDKKELNVLVIEDSPSDAELLNEKIRDFKVLSCRTTAAACMKDVEKMLEKDSYDAIFLDLNLPDSSGLDTVKRINEKRKNAPVIVMTGTSDQELILKTLNLGVQNYIVKGEETAASLERAIMYSIEREKNIEELKKSKKMQEEIIRNAPVMMFVLDKEGKVILINPEAEKFLSANIKNPLGKRTGEACGCVNSFKTMAGCGHSEACDVCPVVAAIKEVFKTGHGEHRKEMPYTVLRNNRPVEKILLISAEKIDFDGDFSVLVSMEDITEMKNAERKITESEQKYSNAFFSSPVGLILTRLSDGKILECNRALEIGFGFTCEELIGKSTIELGLWVNDNDRKIVVEMLTKGQPVVGMEFEFRNSRKEHVSCLYSCVIMNINNEKCVLSTLIDISENKKNKAKLLESEEQFRNAFEQVAVGMTFTSIDGRFINVNKRFCEIIGYTKEEAEKMRFMDITHPDTVEKDVQATKDMIEGKISVYKTNKRYIRKDGSLIWINLTSSLIRNPDNTPKYFVAVYEDISVRKQAEYELNVSEEKWARFSDAVTDVFMIWDRDLKLTAANISAKVEYSNLTGKKLVLGINITDLAKELNIPINPESYKAVLEKGENYYAEEFVLKGEFDEAYHYSLQMFKLGAALGFVMQNNTEIKRSELILKQSYTKLKDVDRLKSNFISIISHELRTPLTIIKGFTSFLIKEAAGPLNDNQKNFVNTIDMNTTRLARIINDMVDMSKIETGNFSVEKERRELIGVINEAVDSMHHIVAEHGITLETVIEVDSARVEVDNGRMMQTITNLINNAMRFTNKDGTIKVGLKSAADASVPAWVTEKMNEEKHYYFIYVSDDGAGIEKKYLEKIFERFYQVENANVRKHQGSGLGLSIAKTIIEAHHGFIWAESDGPGKGTKICMVIPE